MPQRAEGPIASRLSHRHVLVTGASGGLGGAIARAVHARGGRLTLTGRNTQALDSLRTELGNESQLIEADLTTDQGLEHLIDRCGEVDILIANAGLPASGRLASFTGAQLDRALAVNLRAPMRLAQALAPQMEGRGFGHLVFISSLAGKVPTPGSSIYSATKFGLRGFAFALHEELRDSPVGVTTVFPAFIGEVGMWAEAQVDLPRGVGLRAPDDVARAVIRGIETGQAEIDVAPAGLRLGALLSGLSPTLVATVTRKLGSSRVAAAAEEAQSKKR